ncbi:30S ribosomal protein S16 [Aureibacter tunicatorum]|uniref:Small ribosomal subunit protein bS16 n=1 Tax=Aureibacter tunicatorum TaxID=866807 RepID=A0AAE3XKL0_9BACT|nr:30S ribosomal protein S16 [Aureibacter tunicatorum]MDR6237713.1 small subunit ribosomal protein S16 [Aureibacter tunicatorum]BDD02748.1 30S ribosomal protein S16 [Aureibacter tunicatorum]
MAVKIRLARRGRKRRPIYDVVVADSRSPRDGKFIEKIGSYNPNTNPATVLINEEKAVQWVLNGATPTDTARTLLSYRGVMYKKHLQVGVAKGAITQEQADAKYAEWKAQKDAKIEGKVSSLTQTADAAKKAKLDAEAKVNAERAESLKKRDEEAAAAAAPAEEAGEAESEAEETQE